MTAAPAAANQIVFAAAGNFGFVDFDQAGQRTAARASMLGRSLAQMSHAALYEPESELALQLRRRDAIGVP